MVSFSNSARLALLGCMLLNCASGSSLPVPHGLQAVPVIPLSPELALASGFQHNHASDSHPTFRGLRSAAAYSLPEGFVYLDTAAAEQYNENTGNEIVMPQKVNASVGAALDAWIQHIWLTGSGAQEITPGTGRGYVGHTRLVPSLRIEEQILSAGLPSASDAPNSVTSVLYKVRKPGAFPIDDHVAFVRFIPNSETTEIVWTIKLTPSATGSVEFPDPASVAPFLKNAVVQALAGLAQTINTAAQ